MGDRERLRQEQEAEKQKKAGLAARMQEYVGALQEAQQTKNTARLDQVFRSTLQGMDARDQLDLQKLHQAAVQAIQNPQPTPDATGFTPRDRADYLSRGVEVGPDGAMKRLPPMERPETARDRAYADWLGRKDTFNTDSPFQDWDEYNKAMDAYQKQFFTKDGDKRPGVSQLPNFYDWALKVRTRILRPAPKDAPGASGGTRRNARGDVVDPSADPYAVPDAGGPEGAPSPALRGAAPKPAPAVTDGQALLRLYQEAVAAGVAPQFLANLTPEEKQLLSQAQTGK